jgi:O-acetyl-ADP-ribose deacetylase (regulator of RNase III)
MNIILTGSQPLADAWQRFCGDLECIRIYSGSIFDVECDAVVSPANSFGFMDGGIDAQYMEFFGSEIQMSVQRTIFERHHGELLVGSAEIVETGHEKIPYLIAAPTMRVPMKLQESVNAYLAARAVLLLVMHGSFPDGSKIADTVKTIAFPGLGTGVGGIGFNTCARQMQSAIEDTVLDQYKMPKSWAEASERHQLLYTDRPRRLQ